MNKLCTLLAYALFFCSAKAETPISIVVQTMDDKAEIFILNENTRFKIADNELCVIYPEGEYNISYDNLKKIEYSDVSGISMVNNEPAYCFSGNKLTVNDTTCDLDISLFTIDGNLRARDTREM